MGVIKSKVEMWGDGILSCDITHQARDKLKFENGLPMAAPAEMVLTRCVKLGFSGESIKVTLSSETGARSAPLQ